MIITVITPTRGDRPEFIAQCRKYVANQTIKPDYHFVIDYPPINKENDIADRIKLGLIKAKSVKSDFILIFEDDDFYSPEYIETILELWKTHLTPDLIGICTSLYYHIGINKYKELIHKNRASLYQTCFSGKFILPLSLESNYFDVLLWRDYKGTKKTIQLNKNIAIGIKHGTGICGGSGHKEEFFTNGIDDVDKSILKNLTNGENFYLHTIPSK
jgi:hypothetical protein